MTNDQINETVTKFLFPNTTQQRGWYFDERGHTGVGGILDFTHSPDCIMGWLMPHLQQQECRVELWTTSFDWWCRITGPNGTATCSASLTEKGYEDHETAMPKAVCKAVIELFKLG